MLSFKQVMVSSSELCLWSKKRLRCTNNLNNFHYIQAYLTAALLLRENYVFPITCHMTLSSATGSLEGYCFCPGFRDAAYPLILHKRLLWMHRWIAHCKYSQCVSCKMYLIYCRWPECMQCLSHFGYALHRASNLHKCRNVNASRAYQTRNTCSGLMKPEHWSPLLKLDVCKCLKKVLPTL